MSFDRPRSSDAAGDAESMPGPVPAHLQETTYRLWDRLSDFDLAEADRSLDYLLKQLCQRLQAENAFWIGAVRVVGGAPASRDPMSGWRAGALQVLDPQYSAKRVRQRGMKALQTPGSTDPGETSRNLAAGAGRFRVYTLLSGELVDLDRFRRSEHYDLNYRQRGLCDRLWVVFPVNEDVEAYFCFDKYGKRRRFRDHEVALAAHTLRGIKWFHRQQLLMHGLGITEKPLAPAERRVLRCLMSDQDERAIAGQLGLTPGSVHQYVTALYRKFGVRSRNALLSLWLGGSD